MKLAASLFIAANAQEGSGSAGIEARSFNTDVDARGFDYDSFSDYSLGGDYNFGDYNIADYNAGSFYDYDAAAEAEAERESQEDDERKGERYFFTQAATTSTTTTTTTTTPYRGQACWKCDQMTHTACSSEGEIEICEKGDRDCCFIEVRETAQKLQQLCTGCKSRDACENLRDENFHLDTNNSNGVASSNEKTYQCRPDYRQQVIGKHASLKQSVCRQCFNLCDNRTNAGKLECFGSSDTKNGHQRIQQKLATQSASGTFQVVFPWSAFYRQTDAETTNVLGIPIREITSSDALMASITGGTDNVENVWTKHATNGKTAEDGMVYWGIHGADQQWWSSDLKTIQNNARGVTAGSVAAANLQ